MFSVRIQRILLAGAAVLCPVLSASAQDDRSNDTPTGWVWYYGQTSAQVNQLVNSGFRIVDIEVESTSPYSFAVAMVANSGAHAKGWWWLVGVDGSALSSFLSSNNARLIDLEVYDVGGQTRFTAVMISNTGADAKTWYWYYNVSSTFIGQAAASNNARLVDIERYTIGGNTYYAAAMIKNTGADAKAWYWWLGVDTAFLVNEINTKNLRVYDLDRNSDGSHNAILVGNNEAFHWWWYVGVTESSLNTLVAQNGARVIDIERYTVLGFARFNVVMLNNSNELTTRIGDILRTINGVNGLYLKRINGSVLADLQGSFDFEPASTLKTLVHAHAMRQVALGNVSLSQPVTVYTGTSGSCPQYTSPITETLEVVLKKMMENSDNNRTRAAVDFFGQANINNTAVALGLTNTKINHVMGCGGPPQNELTLASGAKLHETIANGWLGAQREKFYQLMSDQPLSYASGKFATVINEEAAALGINTNTKNAFTSMIDMAWKGGSYLYLGPTEEYRSYLNWCRLPFLVNGNIVTREYASGIFIHKSSNSAQVDSVLSEASAELLRDVVHDALESWKDACAASATTYGTGKKGTNGVPTFTNVGLPVLGGNLTVQLGNALPGALPILFLGTKKISVPFDNGTLLVNPIITLNLPAVPANGSLKLVGALPPDPSICGATVHHQVVFFDPGASGAFHTAQTKGLSLTFGF